MVKRSELAGYTYKIARTAASKLYHLRYDLENQEMFRMFRRRIPNHCRVDADLMRRFKKMWLPWSSSFFISRMELEVYCFLSGVMVPEYMPGNVFFTSIAPVLNDKQMAWGYSEKGNYRKLYGIDNEPLSMFRYLNGLPYDFGGNLVSEPDLFLKRQLKAHRKILVKPVFDSWGGRNILVFEKDKNDCWHCLNGKVPLTLKGLKGYYSNSFVVQEFLEQHPFYKRFNSSSFNTVRIYVYRSPADEQVYVLHSVLKSGLKGSFVDNVGAGGMVFYLKPDGTLLPGITKDLKQMDHLPAEPGVSIKELEKAPGVEAMYELAKQVAWKTPFHRLVAMDINIDVTGRPRLVEINLSQPGNGVQLFGFSFWGAFTEEVIEYCKSHKKVDFLRI